MSAGIDVCGCSDPRGNATQGTNHEEGVMFIMPKRIQWGRGHECARITCMSKSAVRRHFMWVIFVLCSMAASIQAAPFSAVVVYGDSLSDNGNLYSQIG